MFENEKVSHVKFGQGSVMECDGVHIKVVFDTGEITKTFVYPTVFEKFLKFDSVEAAQQAEESLGVKHEEDARMENMKRLVYMESEKRLKEGRLVKAKARAKRK